MTVGVTGTPLNIQVTFRGLHRNDKAEVIKNLTDVILEFWEDDALILPDVEQTNCWQKDFMKHYKVNEHDWNDKTKDSEFVELLEWIAGSIAEEKVNDPSIIEMNYLTLNVTLYRDNLMLLVKGRTV